MNAQHFWLLQQYFIATGTACGIGLPETVTCHFAEDTVDCDTQWHVFGNQYATCYLFEDFMSYTDAETHCGDMDAQLILLQESSETKMRTVKDILVKRNISSTWIAPPFEKKLSNFTPGCPGLTAEYVMTLNCDKKLPVTCEKSFVFASGQEKPYIHMKAKGDHEKRILHYGTDVVITCSVIRDKAQQLNIHVQREVDEGITFKNGTALSLSHETLSCGVKTVAQTSIGRKYVALYHVMHIRCFLGDEELDTCSPKMKSCVQILPYTFDSKPDKPFVQVDVDALYRTSVFEPNDIVATCSAILDKHCSIVWAIFEEGEQQRFLKQEDSGVRISAPTLLAGSTWKSEVWLTTKGGEWTNKTVTLTCYSVQDEQDKCEEDDFYCRAVTLHVRESLKKVELHVKISEQPNIVMDEIVANCTSFGFKTVWAITDLSTSNKLNILSRDDAGVEIKETETSKNEWFSKLRMDTEGKDMAGSKLTVGCYITEVDQHEHLLVCLESNFWCDTLLIEISTESDEFLHLPIFFWFIIAGLSPLLLSVLLLVLCELYGLWCWRKRVVKAV